MRSRILVLVAVIVAGGCTSGSETPDRVATAVESTSASLPEDYPDAALRAFWRAMREPRPVEGSAMPPRHLDAERFPTTLVERTEIVAGGPPPDGIPPIDAPRFVAVGDVTDLEPQEAVVVLAHRDDVRIYPVRIMIWHEIVNDVVAGEPLTVTYCPLCNSAVAFRRTIDDRVLDFGTSGYLYRSGLVMYDRQTESLWTHFDGRAVVGTEMGRTLARVPLATVSWEQAAGAHPDALVLQGDVDHPRPYGTNRYVGYDQGDGPLPGWFAAEIPEPIPPMTRVVGVRTPDGELALPTDVLTERGVVAGAIGGLEFVAFHEPGTASPLQRADVTAGDDIGSTGVFSPIVEGRRLEFRRSGGLITDTETTSVWNIRGRAIVGPLVGTQLAELEHVDTFWFAWVGYHPDTQLAVPGGAEPSSRPGLRSP